MIRILVVAILSIIFLSGYWAIRQNTKDHHEDEVHKHAAFNVYTNGNLVDFSGDEYMHVVPCSLEGVGVEHDHNDPIEQVHLHDNIGDIAHVHAEAVVWGDLFNNIDYDFSTSPNGYVNGTIVDDILQTSIENNDRVLIIEGDIENLDAKLASLPNHEYIEEVAARTESCGS